MNQIYPKQNYQIMLALQVKTGLSFPKLANIINTEGLRALGYELPSTKHLLVSEAERKQQELDTKIAQMTPQEQREKNEWITHNWKQFSPEKRAELLKLYSSILDEKTKAKLKL